MAKYEDPRDKCDTTSLYDIAGEQYDEAHAAMLKDHRWGEWVAVFHPRFTGQIIGYVRLKENEWFVEKDGEVEGPWDTLTTCKKIAKAKRATKVEAGIYKANGYVMFTRANALTAIGRDV